MKTAGRNATPNKKCTPIGTQSVCQHSAMTTLSTKKEGLALDSIDRQHCQTKGSKIYNVYHEPITIHIAILYSIMYDAKERIKIERPLWSRITIG